MKLGTENRNTVIAATVLGAIALFLVWRTFFGGGPVFASKPPAAVQPTVPITNAGPAARSLGKRRAGSKNTGSKQDPKLTATLDPRLRFDLLKGSENTEYKGSGRNIFRAEAEPVIPKPIVPPVNPNPTPVTPQPTGPVVVPPPPIPLKFFGFANRPGEPRKAFLLQGEDVFVASEGEVVSRRYKVVKINPNSIEIQDLLSNNTQTIPLTAG